MRRSNPGFTLLELMVAGAAASLVAVAAFSAVIAMQRATGAQIEGAELVSSGRLGMEVMLQDIRSAGDSTELLSAPCIPSASRHTLATGACPAILEAHPWRIILARNAWIPPAGETSSNVLGATSPGGTAFGTNPNNIVAYEFVPGLPGGPPLSGTNFGPYTVGNPSNPAGPRLVRNVIFGRIDRITNPYGFPLAAPAPTRRVTLVENVILDDAMRCDPTNAATCDPRANFALFTYRLAAQPEELLGDPTLVGAGRVTQSLGFLTPPISFYQAAAPALNGTFETVAPTAQWIPGDPGAAQVVGLNADGSASNPLYDATSPDLKIAFSVASLDPTLAQSYMRLVLDRNRIRAVRVAFKVVSEREDPTYTQGIELRTGYPGTAPMSQFDAMAEIKAVGWRVRPAEL